MRKFIHIDMDCFFAAVEMRDNPRFAEVPMAIGGRSHRGVLSTANYLAREFGVRSAMSNFRAKQLCPHLIIVPGRMEVYKSVSLQIRAVFARYTDLIEPLSLDEAYLDVTDSPLFEGSATRLAQHIRQEIYEETGLTASAGIAPVKFVAKIASDENKPNGQCVVSPKDVEHFVAALSLKKIPGVGKVTFEKLQSLGLTYGKDVRSVPESYMIQHFGKFGRELWRRCHGLDNRGVVTEYIRKSVGVERTFPHDIESLEVLTEILITKLQPELDRRLQHYRERKIIRLGVKVKFNDFVQTTKECQFDRLDTHVFTQLLVGALSRGAGKSVRLLGLHVGLDDTQTQTISCEQLGLFEN